MYRYLLYFMPDDVHVRVGVYIVVLIVVGTVVRIVTTYVHFVLM